jgi:AraC-like DNA-binding protein
MIGWAAIIVLLMHPEPSQTINPVVPEHLIAAFGQRPLLRGLMAVAAGFVKGITEPIGCPDTVPRQALFLYCVRGSGWCDVAGRPQTIRQGNILVVPPAATVTCRARTAEPWTIHWARASGALLPDYLEALTSGFPSGVLHVGDDSELVRLFNEIRRALQRGPGMAALLRASHALAYLLAVLIEKHQQSTVADESTTQKVAAAIIYMSEHLDAPVTIPALARLANLSPTYFSGIFKQQTGCAPREYLHLLRIHRACELLNSTELSIKQIAAQAGYQDQFHFSRQFKAFHGLSPTQYRGSPQL